MKLKPLQLLNIFCTRERGWPSGRARNSESRSPGFDPHKGYRVEYCLKARKRWFRPDRTEKNLTGTLNLNTNKYFAKYIHIVMYDSYLLKDVHSVLVNFPREYAQESMMLYI